MITARFSTSAAEQAKVSRSILFRGWSYCCLFAICVIFPLVLIPWADDGAAVAVFVGGAVVGATLWWFMPWLYVWSARRGAAGPNGPYVTTFTDQGVSVQAPHGQVEWNWSG